MGAPPGGASLDLHWSTRRFLPSASLLLCFMLLAAAPTQTLARNPTTALPRIPDLQFGDLGPACVSTFTAAGFIGAALSSTYSPILQVSKEAVGALPLRDFLGPASRLVGKTESARLPASWIDVPRGAIAAGIATVLATAKATAKLSDALLPPTYLTREAEYADIAERAQANSSDASVPPVLGTLSSTLGVGDRSTKGKNRPHQDSTPKPNASTASKRIDVCHRAHLATPPMDAGFTSALRDPTAAFAVSFLRPCALNFDKVCQTVNQSAQIAQQRISKSILDSMTTLSSMPTMWLCSLAQLRKRLAA